MRLAQTDLNGFLDSLNLQGSPVAVRDALLEFFPELIATYGATTAVLGADFYDMLRDVPPSSASFRAASQQAVSKPQAEGVARWALGALFDEQPDAFLARLSGGTQRLVVAPFRDTVFTAAGQDPVRTGVARVPSGATTCKFCVMLASRGAVYSSSTAGRVAGRGVDESANFNADGTQRLFGNRMAQGVKTRGSQNLHAKFHDNCDCMTVTIRSPSDYPEGYDLATLKKLYAKDSGIGREVAEDAQHLQPGRPA